MKKKILRVVLLSALICALTNTVLAAQMHSEERIINRKGAETVDVRIDIPGGKLALSGGTDALLKARFEYRNIEWAPEVDYHVENDQGILKLSISDKESWDWDFSGDGEGWNSDGDHNEWNLRFGDEVPLSLSFHVGALDGDIDLRGLLLKGLDMKVGAGDLDLDMRGQWTGNIEALIEVGAGSLDLKLPSGIGLAVVVESGIGSTHIEGLSIVDGEEVESEGFEIPFLGLEFKSKKGGFFDQHIGMSGVWTNEAYGEADTNLRLRVKLGVGSLDVVVEE